MNILITGANGFLGKHFKEHYSNKEHKVFLMGRQHLDITDGKAVDEFFKNNHVDIVLHTAIKGGTRQDSDTFSELVENILMFRNLCNNSDQFKLMINFGSGAEFDRSRMISTAKEGEIYNRLPADYYGQAKNLITREINKLENVINLRLFGCFGHHENKSRMIKGNILKAIMGDELVVHQDKIMDFFYVKDLCKIIDYILEDPSNFPYSDLNVCYKEKKSLLDVSRVISEKNLHSTKNRVILINESAGNDYFGCPNRLLSLGIDFIGLDKAIQEMYEIFYNEQKV
tara:strand:- start:4425 stop:5279 length:855 start_codon:yes stop_codon:yes gene_type:complete